MNKLLAFKKATSVGHSKASIIKWLLDNKIINNVGQGNRIFAQLVNGRMLSKNNKLYYYGEDDLLIDIKDILTNEIFTSTGFYGKLLIRNLSNIRYVEDFVRFLLNMNLIKIQSGFIKTADMTAILS